MTAADAGELPFTRDVQIVLLLASPHSRYEGRPADGPLPPLGPETARSIELRAGLGVVGDRYFGKPAHIHASVTVMAVEALDAAGADLGFAAGAFNPELTRRNIILRDVDIDALRGARISLDSGDGPVILQVNRPANPCAWMDTVLAPGAHRAMRGRGGMRCEPVTGGVLRLGPAILRSSVDPGSAAD
jgi:MOSC domain-containing protein YiiM